MNKAFRLALASSLVGIFMVITPAHADVVCNTYTYTGHDDSAYPANLPFTLSLGGVEYDQVFVTTNGTLTFGQPDATFHDYPQTPSVSVAGYDWVTWGQGAYVSFGSTENTLCVEWSLRPYPQSAGDLTQIRLVINKYPNGAWHGEVTTFGWLPNDLRRGIRYAQGEPVVTIAGAFDVNGGVPIEVEPAPTPSSFTEPPVVPTQEPTPVVTPSVTPEPTVEPTLEPVPSFSPEPVPSVEPSLNPEPTPTSEPTQSQSPSPSETPESTPLPEPTVEPTPTPEPSTPQPEPTETPTQTPLPTQTPAIVVLPSLAPVAPLAPTPTIEPTVEPTPAPTQTAPNLVPNLDTQEIANALVSEYADTSIPFEVFQASGLDYEDLPPEQPVTLENGVIILAEIADAIEIFNSPTELLTTIFSDPAKAFTALTSAGADMTPESRETSQNVVVSAVIVAQIAQVRKIN
jgi:hypothetical protein